MKDPSDLGAKGKSPAPTIVRDEKGRIVKGSTLNPGGRPQGLRGELLRQGVDKKVIERMVRIWDGEEPKFGPRERMEAGKWLGERIWGKPIDIQAIAKLPDESGDLEEIRLVTTNALIQLAGALSGKPLPPHSVTIDSVPTLAAPDPVGTEPQPQPESPSQDTDIPQE